MKTKKESEPKTYTIRIQCSNCDHEGELNLPKGVEASGQHDCPNCCCKTATKVRSSLPSIPYCPTIPALPYIPPIDNDPPWINPPWRNDRFYLGQLVIPTSTAPNTTLLKDRFTLCAN